MNVVLQKKEYCTQKMVKPNYYNNLLYPPYCRQQIWNIIFPFFKTYIKRIEETMQYNKQ